MQHYHAVIWIDHETAKVFSMNLAGANDEWKVHPHDKHVHIHHKAGTVSSAGKAAPDKHYFHSVAEAVALHNRLSPRFMASLISESAAEHDRFFATVDAPFVGDGFTRWVDGQYALGTPELGLANWEHGRILGRGAILRLCQQNG